MQHFSSSPLPQPLSAACEVSASLDIGSADSRRDIFFLHYQLQQTHTFFPIANFEHTCSFELTERFGPAEPSASPESTPAAHSPASQQPPIITCIADHHTPASNVLFLRPWTREASLSVHHFLLTRQVPLPVWYRTPHRVASNGPAPSLRLIQKEFLPQNSSTILAAAFFPAMALIFPKRTCENTTRKS